MASPFVEDLILWFMSSNPGIDVSLGSAARNIIEQAATLFEQRAMPFDLGLTTDLATMHGIHVNIAPFVPLQEVKLTFVCVERNAWAMISADVDA